MLEKPKKPETLQGVDGDLNDDNYVMTLEEDAQIAALGFREKVKAIKTLPRNRLDLLKTLEEEMSLTGACLSSYIVFKS